MTLKETLRDEYHAMALQAQGIVGFELMYKPAVVLILGALLVLFIHLAMKIQHFSYLKANNLERFLRTPSALLFGAILALLWLFFSLVEMFAVTHALGAAHQNERLTGVDIFRSTLYTLKELFSLKLFFTFPFVIGMSVFATFPSIILTTTNTGIPEYFRSFMSRNHSLNTFAFIVLLVVLYLLGMRCIVFCFSTLSGLPLKNAWAACSSLNSRRFWKNTLTMLCWYMILCFFVFIVYCFTVFFTAIFVKLFAAKAVEVMYFLRCTRVIALIMAFVLQIMFFPIYYSMIVTIYACWEKSEGKRACVQSYGEPFKHKKHVKILMATTVSILMLANITGGAYIYFSNIFDDIVFTRRAEVAAHRGSEKRAPENSMEAIALAVEEGADYVEIDVRLTKDGFVVLSHDEDLMRTAGVNKKVSELTYEQLLQYDISGSFHKKYGEVRIPTLEAVLDYTRGKVTLIIELKPNENDAGIAEATMEILTRKEMVGKCLIQSFDYNCLKKVKEINPEQECGIIFKIPAGIYEEMEGIDFYCVKCTFLSDTYIERMHALGRRVFVWGGMKNIAICEMNNLGVDVFIATDSVRYATVLSEQRSNWVEQSIGRLFFGGQVYKITTKDRANFTNTGKT